MGGCCILLAISKRLAIVDEILLNELSYFSGINLGFSSVCMNIGLLFLLQMFPVVLEHCGPSQTLQVHL